MTNQTARTFGPDQAEAIRQGLGEWGGALAELSGRHFTEAIATTDPTADRIRPMIIAARTQWVNRDKNRTASSFKLSTFVDLAASEDQKWEAFTAGSELRKAFARLYTYCLLHTPENQAKYTAYALGQTSFDGYVRWLPSADDYTKAGNLKPAIREAKTDEATRKAAQDKASAEATMFDTDVMTYVADKTTMEAKVVELMAIVHDATAAIARLRAAAPKDTAKATSTFKARVVTRTTDRVNEILAEV